MNSYLSALILDYESSDYPVVFDPRTQETLDMIKIEIQLGRISANDFYTFVDDNLGSGDFATKCKMHVLGYI